MMLIKARLRVGVQYQLVLSVLIGCVISGSPSIRVESGSPDHRPDIAIAASLPTQADGDQHAAMPSPRGEAAFACGIHRVQATSAIWRQHVQIVQLTYRSLGKVKMRALRHTPGPSRFSQLLSG